MKKTVLVLILCIAFLLAAAAPALADIYYSGNCYHYFNTSYTDEAFEVGKVVMVQATQYRITGPTASVLYQLYNAQGYQSSDADWLGGNCTGVAWLTPKWTTISYLRVTNLNWTSSNPYGSRIHSDGAVWNNTVPAD